MPIAIFRSLSVCFLAALASSAYAQTDEIIPAIQTIQLQHSAHVCNDEQETKRLAENDHLREMAKALVEFKATKYCSIMQLSTQVTLLEHHGSYIKFSHDNKVLYTFAEHLLTL